MKEKTKAPHFTRLKADLLRFVDKLKGKRRLERIDSLLRILNFERRLAMLTREELASMNDEFLSPASKKRYNEVVPAERKELIEGHARTIYFRRCAWLSYLDGNTEDKPFTSRKKAKAA